MKQERDKVLWLLQKNNLTQTWLINQLEGKGFSITKTNLSDILRGVRKNEITEIIIQTSLNILESYEQWAMKQN